MGEIGSTPEYDAMIRRANAGAAEASRHILSVPEGVRISKALEAEAQRQADEFNRKREELMKESDRLREKLKGKYSYGGIFVVP